MLDRAEVATTAIVHIFEDVLGDRIAIGSTAALVKAHVVIAAYLSDEFADLARMVRDDIRLRDD